MAAIALAVAFNGPYSILGATYDYPHVLRRPAGEALERFAQGGPALIMTWYAFMLTALALTIIAPALAVTPARLARTPGVAFGAAASGALAGLAQAIGLSRWVFAVPALARQHDDPAARAAAEQAFALLNGWGGVAIGEHIGQLLTAAFVLQLGLLQRSEGARMTSLTGLATGALLAVGAAEGVSLALGGSGEPFGTITIAGFLGLTVWLVATGVGLMRRPANPAH